MTKEPLVVSKDLITTSKAFITVYKRLVGDRFFFTIEVRGLTNSKHSSVITIHDLYQEDIESIGKMITNLALTKSL